MWQCFLNMIRLTAHEMRCLLCTQKQNIKDNWQRLRSLTINQEFANTTFTWKTTLFCNTQRLHKRLRNAKFYFKFRFPNLKTNYGFKLSLIWITGKPLRTFSRHFKSKKEVFWSMQSVFKQKLPDLIKYQSRKFANSISSKPFMADWLTNFPKLLLVAKWFKDSQ